LITGQLQVQQSTNPLASTKPNFTIEELNDVIIDAIQDIKGKKIVNLDLRKVNDAQTDYFIIAEGESNVQVRAMADSIYRKVKEELQTTPDRIEGGMQSTWVVLDFFYTVVHLFLKETRQFYQLEDLWSDAKFTYYPDID
jgi:ribosome-associated protein